jgi:isoleucyl-tRNA synthetase
LSNWYVRLNRRRFWKGEMSLDKQMAYETLFRCLHNLAQLISPIAPFFSERLYGDLNISVDAQDKSESVHLSYWPKKAIAPVDQLLNDRMSIARKLSSMVLALRKKERLKVRQPLQKIMVPALNEDQAKLMESVRDILLAETNVKELEVLHAGENLLVKSIKADFKKLGPRFGKMMKQVAAAINQLNQDDISTLEQEGTLNLNLGGEKIEILSSDVSISTEDIPGWLVQSEEGLTVALDVNLNEALIREGISRELVSRIQNLRKDSGLEVTDRIILNLQKDESLKIAVTENGDYIRAEVLADSIVWSDDLAEGNELIFDEIFSRISIVVRD